MSWNLHSPIRYHDSLLKRYFGVYMEIPEYLKDILEHIINEKQGNQEVTRKAKKMLNDRRQSLSNEEGIVRTSSTRTRLAQTSGSRTSLFWSSIDQRRSLHLFKEGEKSTNHNRHVRWRHLGYISEWEEYKRFQLSSQEITRRERPRRAEALLGNGFWKIRRWYSRAPSRIYTRRSS